MVIKERFVGKKNPFRYEYIPETEEERFELAIRSLREHLPKNSGGIFVEKSIFDKAVEQGDIHSNSILLIDADTVEVHSVFDNKNLTYSYPEWWLELINKSAANENVILVLDSLSTACDEHKLRCLISLVKDRTFLCEDIPANVSIVITETSYDDLIHNNETVNELLSMCIPISLQQFQGRA